ncbi:MAG: Na+/H+ antiporter NhaA [Pseudomonadota bacterium]
MAAPKTPRSGSNSALRNFLESEAAGGVLLMISAAVAMIIANTPLYDVYHHVLHEIEGPVLTEKLGPMTPHLWINDGLMAIFFFLVGLEIKREFIDGRLATWDDRRLPVIAALGGMAVPAIVFIIVIYAAGMPELSRGWAIPAATDIAFAIGVLALLGNRVPASLKLFLVTVAIVDDMCAVAIIALFYTSGLKIAFLAAAAVVLAIMFGINRAGVRSLPIYFVFTLVLWYLVLMSGVHATIAGVLAALTIPITKSPGAPDDAESPLHVLEHAIAPISAFFIIPVFGFANAGVEIIGKLSWSEVFAPLPLGIALGLLVGKQLGIFGSIWVCVKIGFAKKIPNANWQQIYGLSMMCGIGFTMSLFIGELAFAGKDPYMQLLRDEAKIGILMGSIVSAVVGYFVLRSACNKRLAERAAMAAAEKAAATDPQAAE